ncbi:LOW QUALITY PROTEIN: hypothetical protein ACHAXR_008891, partial [Thalassiosira sp. AJA248-18]
ETQLGPTRKLTLQTGEFIVKTSSKVPSRCGRSDVLVRVFGDSSFGWAEATTSWGGTLEAFITSRACNKSIRNKFKLPTTLSYAGSQNLSPAGQDWDGIFCATIREDSDARKAKALFQTWRPLIAIFALPSCLSRSRMLSFTRGTRGDRPLQNPDYQRLVVNVRHHEVGGVTNTNWRFMYLSRLGLGTQLTRELIMIAPQYPRSLQTSLDDTLGSTFGQGQVQFEKLRLKEAPRDNVIGYVSVKRQTVRAPVYDSNGQAPDIGNMPNSGELSGYELVKTPGKKLIRTVKQHELQAMWDYEGKGDLKRLPRDLTVDLLNWRLASPPGKMIRSLLYTAWVLPSKIKDPGRLQTPGPGMTLKVPFSPLEAAAGVRMKAAQPDGAEVDLSPWALEGEDDKTVAARQVLRKFAAKWWYQHQAKLAREWLQQLGTPSQADIDGVDDCLRRLKATTYLFTSESWNSNTILEVQSSRLDFRDGVRFWKTAEPPRGNMKNMTAPSRDAELLAREKVFKLWWNRYIQIELATLRTPRFIVPKVIENEGTSEEKIVDVRLVWDCKINGFNVCIWAPGFMLA